MKCLQSVAFATWMLDHLTFGVRNNALTGDLLEELQCGRSAGWYWRQVLVAIGVALSSRSRVYALPLVFSAGWSILYPELWFSIMRSRFVRAILDGLAAYDWPYSTGLQFVRVVLPAALFVWLGLFIYLASHKQLERKLSALRLMGSLSISLNVLLVALIGQHLGDFGVSLRDLSWESINSHLVAISVPLALSLFSALIFALPPMRQCGVDPTLSKIIFS
jgi:hypothetical protein